MKFLEYFINDYGKRIKIFPFFLYLLQLLVLLPLLFGTAKLGAQVSIGADKTPKPFSVLELVSQYKTGTYGGLRLPQKGYCHCIKKCCTFATSVNNIKYFINN